MTPHTVCFWYTKNLYFSKYQFGITHEREALTTFLAEFIMPIEF